VGCASDGEAGQGGLGSPERTEERRPDEIPGAGHRPADHEDHCSPAAMIDQSPRRLTPSPETAILKQVLNSQPQLDLVFQALSDPTRRAIVERLGRGPASVSQLAQPFAMSLPAVLQHVAVLEASGLVRSEKVGRVRTCKIDSRTLSVAGRWIQERRTTWERRLDRLGVVLAEQPD
jgi:DNA-binding transcriptional ArsR family regulator